MISERECNRKISKRFHSFYYCYKNVEFLEKNIKCINKATKKFKTMYKKKVSNLIEDTKFSTETEKLFAILKDIYDKNTKYAFFDGEKPLNSNLLGLVANVPFLILAYKIARNDAIHNPLVYSEHKQSCKKVKVQAKNFLNEKQMVSEIINFRVFCRTSKLIKEGKYPWGINRRLLIKKYGNTGKKSSLTIPLFMDRVVQILIKMILVAIYEPLFEKMNVSFGFRPRKSLVDAICQLTSQSAIGLNIAFEGHIKLPYQTLNAKKLIQILGKKINDRKFLKLIEHRLEFEDDGLELDIYLKDRLAISQDGPYLFNIYMLEFDDFIKNEIEQDIKHISSQCSKTYTVEKLKKEKEFLSNSTYTIKKVLNWVRKTRNEKGNYLNELKELNKDVNAHLKLQPGVFEVTTVAAKRLLKELNLMEENSEKNFLMKLQKKLKTLNLIRKNMTYFRLNNEKIRILYVRFSYDWFILTNLKVNLLIKIKEKILMFLKEELFLTLLKQRTLITKINEKPARFIGSEIRGYNVRKIQPKSMIVGNQVFAAIDKQKCLYRMNMIGCCRKDGFPREISKLSSLHSFRIIEKYNSLLTALTNHYVNFVKKPKSDLNRWIYILRYSCIKTIAQKHKLSTRGVYKTFLPKKKDKSEENTIEVLRIDRLCYVSIIKAL